MKILPALDLKDGQIVRGVGGRRDEYRPLVESAEPLAAASAIRNRFGFHELYLADLGAIAGGPPDLHVCHELQDAGFSLWLDAGVRTHVDRNLKMLIVANVTRIIVGLETLQSPEHLRHIVARLGPERVVFSLDLKAGRPLGQLDAWKSDDPFAIAQHAIANLGVRQLIVLDLARVGGAAGVGTEELCGRVRSAFPEVNLTAGGGVNDAADLRRLAAIGVDQVLVASALHDGRLAPAQLKSEK